MNNKFKLSITHPDANITIIALDKLIGTIRFLATSSGKYTMCYINMETINQEGEKILMDSKISYINQFDDTYNINESIAKEEHFTKVFAKAKYVQNKTQELISYQEMTLRHSNDFHEYQESLHWRVTSVTIYQLIIFCACAGYQIYSLNKFFIKKMTTFTG